MISRHDFTAETYDPIPFSSADFRRLKKAFRDRAPEVELDRGHTDTGEPFVTVTVPSAGFDDAPPCITRNERGWQMHRGGDGPLYEFATAREVAEFFTLKEVLGQLRPEPEREAPAPATALRAVEQGALQATGMKPYRGPPMTLESAAAAHLRLMVWCKECGRRSEPDPAEQARWYGPETPAPEWRRRLVCSQCGKAVRNIPAATLRAAEQGWYGRRG